MVLRRGRRLALDVGRARIGVAVCDPDGILATPVETIRAAADGSDIRRVLELVRDYEPIQIVLGMPVTLRNEHGESARMAEEFGARLAVELDKAALEETPRVCFTDERLTTVTAQRALRENGVRARNQKSVIDQAAAVAILQGWLDAARARRDGLEEDA